MSEKEIFNYSRSSHNGIILVVILGIIQLGLLVCVAILAAKGGI